MSNEIKIEIGDNLKEVMLDLLKIYGEYTNANFPLAPAMALKEAFNLDFSKVLKKYGNHIHIVDRKETK